MWMEIMEITWNHPILKSQIMSELAQFVSDLWISTGATIACCAKRRLKAELQSLEVWWFSSGRLVVSLWVFESSWGRIIEEPAISEVIFLLKVRNSTISEYQPSAGAIAFCWVGWTLGWCGAASQLDLFNYSYGKLGGGFSISKPYAWSQRTSFIWLELPTFLPFLYWERIGTSNSSSDFTDAEVCKLTTLEGRLKLLPRTREWLNLYRGNQNCFPKWNKLLNDSWVVSQVSFHPPKKDTI